MLTLTDLSTRTELRELVDRYAAAADRREGGVMAAMFTQDGELTLRLPEAAAPVVFRGPAEIAGQMKELQRFRVTSHVVSNQVLELESATAATGETYCTASHIYDTEDDGSRMCVMSIRYRDSFVLADGDWKFAARDLHVDWVEDRPFTAGSLGL